MKAYYIPGCHVIGVQLHFSVGEAGAGGVLTDIYMRLLRAFHTCKVRIDQRKFGNLISFCNVFFPNLKARMFIT